MYIKNGELTDTREKVVALENAIESVDNELTKLKEKTKFDGKYYLLETYDGDNSCERHFRLFLDKELARKEFLREMKFWFREELEKCGLPEDFDWTKVEEYEGGGFKFTTDNYRFYRDRQWARGEKVDEGKYPRYTRKAYNPDYYTEITLTPITITTDLEDNKETE